MVCKDFYFEIFFKKVNTAECLYRKQLANLILASANRA